MPPRLRKLALTVHVAASVGWLGAVAAFLALALTGLASQDVPRVRGAYLAMDAIARLVLLPLSLASLLTGILQSLGTRWGLLRHYWIVLKLLINVLATFALLLHTQPIALVADAAAEGALSGADLREARVQLVASASAALLALLVAVGLAVYKPRGLTPYGWRKRQEERARTPRP